MFLRALPHPLALLLGLILCALSSTVRGQTHTATFENYPECQFFYQTFTDPQSGILFNNLQPGGNNYFSTDYGGPHQELPTLLPSTILATDSCANGDGFLVTAGFGFDGHLPANANRVSLAVAFSHEGAGTGRIILEGYSSSGLFLTRSIREVSQLGFGETELAINSGAFNIGSFTVRSTDISTSYDNIAYTVPEPAFLLPILATIPFLRRRKVTMQT